MRGLDNFEPSYLGRFRKHLSSIIASNWDKYRNRAFKYQRGTPHASELVCLLCAYYPRFRRLGVKEIYSVGGYVSG